MMKFNLESDLMLEFNIQKYYFNVDFLNNIIIYLHNIKKYF